MAKKYIEKSFLENYSLTDIAVAYDSQIDNFIETATAFIDDFCNFVIYVEGSETYKYDGDGTDTLLIKPCHSITSVTVDDNEKINNDDLYQYPANEDYTNRLEFDGDTFTKDRQNVEVTAVQSKYSEVPSDIKFACAVLVTGIINDQKHEEKRGISKDIGNFSVRYTNDAGKADLEKAMKILEKHRSIAI